ncbi:MAG: alanine--tRNA ligase [Candidatus Omnitrophota bacterium]|jgi:alanyl-tRNA synthetase
MLASELRVKFLDFFKARKHKITDSDSLVPKDDPTVLFTPAGMNQFKKEFLGFDSGFPRAATCQRCLRTDDLIKVGKTSGHHTFFEMLGNFSFGDYFKKEAINWAWEFLTEVLKIDKAKFWVSVYKDDEETYKLWNETIKIPSKRIVKLGDKENFWPSEAKEKGPNGPCGPCSEIFFDQGSGTGCKSKDCSLSCGCGRFMEVWNLVFTQFNRKEGGKLESLPNKNIDTGMGLERLAAVMQGVSSNFETDLFTPIISEINNGSKNEAGDNKPLIYAIADHIRAVTFSIYDGVLPSNEGRGYIVRKLVRKSVLHLRSLGISQPYLFKLVVPVALVMKPFYPDLMVRKENIAEIILSEERSFINTLNSSDTLLKEKFQGFLKVQNPEEVGRITFQFHDTYGMPLELTQGWLEMRGIKISMQAFNDELNRQKERSKLQSSMKGDVFSAQLDYGVKETRFLGYKESQAKAKVIKIMKGNEPAKKISKGEEGLIILDKTTFYAERGGQVGDKGQIVKGKNIFEVSDTRRSGNVTLHIGKVKTGSFKTGDEATAKIDIALRVAIERNHTATHLLQAALRKVLGPHVQQQGSLVAQGRLRFDFSHFKDITNEEINHIEEFVNKAILENLPVEKKEKSLQEAKKSGALAFFGEKYEGKVRVVSIMNTSMELCGGTHLDSTGSIGLFKIIHEGSVSSGVRRIEAVTGAFAYKAVKEEEGMISELGAILNTPKDKIVQEVEKRSVRLKELEKELNMRRMELLKDSCDELVANAEIVNGTKVILKVFEGLDMNLLRKNVDLLKEKAISSVVGLGSSIEGRALLVVGVTPDLCAKGLDATKLIRSISGLIGGSGGGRSDFAQAGGNNPGNLKQALEELKSKL